MLFESCCCWQTGERDDDNLGVVGRTTKDSTVPTVSRATSNCCRSRTREKEPFMVGVAVVLLRDGGSKDIGFVWDTFLCVWRET